MNKLLELICLKLDGVPVVMVPWFQYDVEVVFASDVFSFWGGTPLTFTDGEEFLRVMRESIHAAGFHLGERKARRIYIGWALYWKLRKALAEQRNEAAKV